MATYWIIFCWLFILRYSFIECNMRTLTYTNSTYSYDKEIANFTAIVNDGALSLYLTTFKDLEHFVIDLDVFVKTEESARFSEVSKTTMDICKLLENAGSNIFISRFLDPILKNKQNRIFRKCPVRKVTELNRISKR